MGVGLKIKSIAERDGIPLKEVARRAGIPYTTLYSLVKRDSDKTSMETLVKIANALVVRLSELYDYDKGSAEQAAVDSFEAGYYLGSDAHTMKMASYGYTFTSDERILIGTYRKLNAAGQEKAIERMEELTEIPKYQRNSEE